MGGKEGVGQVKNWNFSCKMTEKKLKLGSPFSKIFKNWNFFVQNYGKKLKLGSPFSKNFKNWNFFVQNRKIQISTCHTPRFFQKMIYFLTKNNTQSPETLLDLIRRSLEHKFVIRIWLELRIQVRIFENCNFYEKKMCFSAQKHLR